MSTTLTKSLRIAALVAVVFSTSHAVAADKIVKVDGSSTVYPITEAVAEEFQNATKTKVTVGVSGTGGGFKKFCRGETDISNASRPILQKEIDACKEAGVQFIELPVAYDALTVVINPKNTFAKTMTVAELNKMWAPAAQGKIKTWNQVNPAWPNVPLKLFGAGSDSGTFDYFTEAIVGKAKSQRGDYTATEDDHITIKGVAGDVNAIGYLGFAYYSESASQLAAVAIVNKPGSKAVLPSKESIEDSSYQPLGRPIFIYVNATAAAFKPEVKAFVNFYLEKGRPLIEEVKYVPLPAKAHNAVIAHWKKLLPGTGFGGKSEVGVDIEELLARIK
ncbi:MAG: PstS family phosphate ABC transporter substrate-binding protein [Methylotenera sp.]|nr:PstS family phosphate ABC transporter substrate-binding protein [Methylotenera sp.]